MTRKYIVGNWKMNGAAAQAQAFTSTLAQHLQVQPETFTTKRKIIVCPPFPYLGIFRQQNFFEVGGQDCSPHPQGAFTGEVSATMLRDVGCGFVLVGHSERRQYHQESNDLVKQKAETALAMGLKVILCLGETASQRKAQEAENTVTQQLQESLPVGATPDTLLVAYEPVWAIGTGAPPTFLQIQEMHSHLHQVMAEKKFPLLYGGSVTPENAASFLALPLVDGLLVGGASLQIHDFWAIIQGQ